MIILRFDRSQSNWRVYQYRVTAMWTRAALARIPAALCRDVSGAPL